MIPVKPFTVRLPCERCQFETTHRITFLSYCPTKNIVYFEAVCFECEEYATDNEVVGFTSYMKAEVWDSITPIADEFVAN